MRRFLPAALWALARAVLSAAGLIHGYQFTMADTVQSFAFGANKEFVYGYLMLAAMLYAGRFGKLDFARSERRRDG